jgi:hypothetical protein
VLLSRAEEQRGRTRSARLPSRETASAATLRIPSAM